MYRALGIDGWDDLNTCDATWVPMSSTSLPPPPLPCLHHASRQRRPVYLFMRVGACVCLCASGRVQRGFAYARLVCKAENENMGVTYAQRALRF